MAAYRALVLRLGGVDVSARCDTTTCLHTVQATVQPISLELQAAASKKDDAHSPTVQQPGRTAVVASLAACTTDAAPPDTLPTASSDPTTAGSAPAWVTNYVAPQQLAQASEEAIQVMALVTLPEPELLMSTPQDTEVSSSGTSSHVHSTRQPQRTAHVTCSPLLCAVDANVLPTAQSITMRLVQGLSTWAAVRSSSAPVPAPANATPDDMQQRYGVSQSAVAAPHVAVDAPALAVSAALPLIAVAAFAQHGPSGASHCAALVASAYLHGSVSAAEVSASMHLPEVALTAAHKRPASATQRHAFDALDRTCSAERVVASLELEPPAAEGPLAACSVDVSVASMAAHVCASHLSTWRGLGTCLQTADAKTAKAPKPSERGSSFGTAQLALAVNSTICQLRKAAAAVGGIRANVALQDAAILFQRRHSAPAACRAGDGSNFVEAVMPLAEVRMAGDAAQAALACTLGDDSAAATLCAAPALRVFNAACQAWDVIMPAWHVALRLDMADSQRPAAQFSSSRELHSESPPLLLQAPAAAARCASAATVPRLSFEGANALDFTVTENLFRAMAAAKDLLDATERPAKHAAQLQNAGRAAAGMLRHPCTGVDVMECPVVVRNATGLTAHVALTVLPAASTSAVASTSAKSLTSTAGEGAAAPTSAASLKDGTGQGVMLGPDATHVAATLRQMCEPCMLPQASSGDRMFHWSIEDLKRCGFVITVQQDSPTSSSDRCKLGPLPFLPLLSEQSTSGSITLASPAGGDGSASTAQAARLRITASLSVGAAGCIELALHTSIRLINDTARAMRLRGKGCELGAAECVVPVKGSQYAPAWLVAFGGFQMQPANRWDFIIVIIILCRMGQHCTCCAQSIDLYALRLMASSVSGLDGLPCSCSDGRWGWSAPVSFARLRSTIDPDSSAHGGADAASMVTCAHGRSHCGRVAFDVHQRRGAAGRRPCVDVTLSHAVRAVNTLPLAASVALGEEHQPVEVPPLATAGLYQPMPPAMATVAVTLPGCRASAAHSITPGQSVTVLCARLVDGAVHSVSVHALRSAHSFTLVLAADAWVFNFTPLALHAALVPVAAANADTSLSALEASGNTPAKDSITVRSLAASSSAAALLSRSGSLPPGHIAEVTHGSSGAAASSGSAGSQPQRRKSVALHREDRARTHVSAHRVHRRRPPLPGLAASLPPVPEDSDPTAVATSALPVAPVLAALAAQLPQTPPASTCGSFALSSQATHAFPPAMRAASAAVPAAAAPVHAASSSPFVPTARSEAASGIGNAVLMSRAGHEASAAMLHIARLHDADAYTVSPTDSCALTLHHVKQSCVRLPVSTGQHSTPSMLQIPLSDSLSAAAMPVTTTVEPLPLQQAPEQLPEDADNPLAAMPAARLPIRDLGRSESARALLATLAPAAVVLTPARVVHSCMPCSVTLEQRAASSFEPATKQVFSPSDGAAALVCVRNTPQARVETPLARWCLSEGGVSRSATVELRNTQCLPLILTTTQAPPAYAVVQSDTVALPLPPLPAHVDALNEVHVPRTALLPFDSDAAEMHIENLTPQVCRCNAIPTIVC